MFGWFGKTLRKSEAAVVAQNVLEDMASVTGASLAVEPRMIANRLVGIIWEHKPPIFDGRDGYGPLHKLTVAIAALAHGIHVYRNDPTIHLVVLLALGQLLSEAESHGHRYGLSPKDYWLIRQSAEVFEHADNKLDKFPGLTDI